MLFRSNYRITILGSMLAKGTASKRIKFTSNKATPSPGDWTTIYLEGNGNPSTFNYCDFEYGGHPLAGTTQIIYFDRAGSNITFNHCTISNSVGYGVSVYYQSYPTFNYCQISNNNSYGIYDWAGMKLRHCTITRSEEHTSELQSH